MLCSQYTILRRETAREKQGKNRAAGAAKKYFEKIFKILQHPGALKRLEDRGVAEEEAADE